MTGEELVDTRTYTARARRQMINRHLYRDHGAKLNANQSVSDRYRLHRRLHESGVADHDHEDLDDISTECAKYIDPKPLRVRTDRPPKKWMLTYHIAKEHGTRFLGDKLLKTLKHAELHDQDPDGWAGEPLHRHPNEDDLSIVEYKEASL